ncbi:hypothetical protein NLX62_01435 [Mycobacteriaceae bacterium Msp059]|nr:hypothetical protein [Mycobacteriaceae bacterium Msp059]
MCSNRSAIGATFPYTSSSLFPQGATPSPDGGGQVGERRNMRPTALTKCNAPGECTRTLCCMENVEERRAAMIAQAGQILAEARLRESMASTVTYCVTGALAYGLREQGLSDKAIGEILSVSRNRVGDLVKAGIWPTLFARIKLDDDRRRKFAAAEMKSIYRPVAQEQQEWVHTRTDCSGYIAERNNIPIPREYRHSPGSLEPEAAEFDNCVTGERIVVYTLERHHGKMLFDSEHRRVGYDYRGEYRIELCSASGARHPLPLELLGITSSELRFGDKWADPEERRLSDDAFRNAVAAVRKHYGIWPLPSLNEDDATYWDTDSGLHSP